MPAPRCVRLHGETDFEGFRREARALLREGIAPGDVTWSTGELSLFDAAAGQPAVPAGDGPSQLTLPRALMQAIAGAARHSNPERFALLYRLLWRLRAQPFLRHDPLDADVQRVQHMAQAVRRDMHKMKAFVRFRPINDGDDGATGPLHVAWFEPSHHVVEATAPFFARRFATMRWAILTPRGSARWEPLAPAGRQLHLGPPAQRSDTPGPDAGEALWLTYYQHIFNPARLKMKMMQKEMPRKYWHNLPEAALIAPLAAAAHERTARMIAQEPRVPERVVRFLPPKSAPVHISTLADLGAAMQRCRDCPIGEHATQAVCGEGPPAASGPSLMFVGEQPGYQEDLHGRPFVGPSGQLFDRAMADIGLPRDTVFVTNAVRHFKFELRGKRRIHKTPSQREAAACRHWLDEEIRLVKPRALVALGATAARALLGNEVRVTDARGRWHRPGVHGLPVLVTLHPSALLRMEPAQQADAYAAWLDDLRLVFMPPRIGSG